MYIQLYVHTFVFSHNGISKRTRDHTKTQRAWKAAAATGEATAAEMHALTATHAASHATAAPTKEHVEHFERVALRRVKTAKYFKSFKI